MKTALLFSLLVLGAGKRPSVTEWAKKLLGPDVHFAIEDVANGFVRSDGAGQEGYSEVAMWNAGGLPLLALASVGCGPACEMNFSVYEPGADNAPLVDVTKTAFPSAAVQTLLEGAKPALRHVATDETPPTPWYLLPRKGTTLTVGWLQYPAGKVVDAEFFPVAELRLKGRTFEVTKKFTTAETKHQRRVLR